MCLLLRALVFLGFEVLVESAFRELPDGAFPTLGKILETSFRTDMRKAHECITLRRWNSERWHDDVAVQGFSSF